MKKILVASDGSEYGLKAEDIARDLQSKFECDVVMIAVYPNKGEMEIPAPYRFSRDMDNMRSEKGMQAKKRMLEIEDMLETSKTKFQFQDKVRTFVLYGDPVKTIVDLADKEDVDLIVIGSRGLSGIRKALLGSVSSQVINGTNRSVYIVK